MSVCETGNDTMGIIVIMCQCLFKLPNSWVSASKWKLCVFLSMLNTTGSNVSYEDGSLGVQNKLRGVTN